jgi:hypothetical protein
MPSTLRLTQWSHPGAPSSKTPKKTEKNGPKTCNGYDERERERERNTTADARRAEQKRRGDGHYTKIKIENEMQRSEQEVE